MGPRKECELCGRETYSLVRREIEGVLMYVCPDCKEYGVEPKADRLARAKQIRRKRNSEKFQSIYKTGTSSGVGSGSKLRSQHSSQRSISRKRNAKIANLKVVDNAPEILLKCRTKLGLSAKDFAHSVLVKDNYYKRIEKNTTPLPIDIARKFEKKYRLKLVEEENAGDEEEILSKFMAPRSKSADSVIYFRKRGEKPEYDQ
ncbi:helix-turn-helix domain-containing protein [Candidatus Harpocratesius sp.]